MSWSDIFLIGTVFKLVGKMDLDYVGIYIFSFVFY